MRKRNQLLLVGVSILSLLAMLVAVFIVASPHGASAAAGPNVLPDDSVLNAGHPQFKALPPRGHGLFMLALMQ